MSPLTGEDHEWKNMSSGFDINLRARQVVRVDGVAIDTLAILWENPDGSVYSNSHSRVPITFPYTLRTVTRPSSEDPGDPGRAAEAPTTQR